ncbi:MAG: MarR family transcriptional regulator [Steroidobacteraceae bacterium]|nr:MarR family transcriptional regulator [Steroidobacteraceae bacterium]
MAASEPIGFLVYDVNRLIRKDYGARVARLGLTQAQWRALAHLSRMEGCRQTQLAETLEVRPITAGRLVDRLQKAGLVRRSEDPRDRRAFQLHLTPASRRLLRRLREIGEQTIERALDGLGATERRRLHEMLAHVRTNLQDPPRRRGLPAGERAAPPSKTPRRTAPTATRRTRTAPQRRRGA